MWGSQNGHKEGQRKSHEFSYLRDTRFPQIANPYCFRHYISLLHSSDELQRALVEGVAIPMDEPSDAATRSVSAPVPWQHPQKRGVPRQPALNEAAPAIAQRTRPGVMSLPGIWNVGKPYETARVKPGGGGMFTVTAELRVAQSQPLSGFVPPRSLVS